ncbi:hypothetical protein LguiA_032741 [Lonicera macranthoides]
MMGFFILLPLDLPSLLHFFPLDFTTPIYALLPLCLSSSIFGGGRRWWWLEMTTGENN